MANRSSRQSKDVHRKPSKKAILAQIEQLCASDYLRGEKRPDLLRFLVKLELGGRWFTSNPKPSGKLTIFEFYKHWAVLNKQEPPKHPDDTEVQGRNLVHELDKGLVDYYAASQHSHEPIRIRVRTGKWTGYQPLIGGWNDGATRPSSSTPTSQLATLLKKPIHSYHLTLDREGHPMWLYTVLHFKSDPALDQPRGIMIARAVNFPENYASKAKRKEVEETYLYEYEASLTHFHLVLRVRSAGDTDDDVSFRIFPAIGDHLGIWCGVGLVAHTWHENPASTMFILSKTKLSVAPNAVIGEPIKDPQIMADLCDIWSEGAQRINLARLLGGVTIYPNWDKFSELLNTVKRDDNDPKTDLRVATMGFRDAGVPEDKFLELAGRGVRIKVLLTNPKTGSVLIRARNELRGRRDLGGDGETPKNATLALNDQIKKLRFLAQQVKDRRQKRECKGSFDFALSGLMPHAFVAMSNRFMVLGLFLADRSYGKGPMIVVDSASNRILADALCEEWERRWKFAQEESRRATKKGAPHSIARRPRRR